MLNIKTLNEVIINIINNIHDALPDADTKEGTFLRDVIIDPIALEFSDIYNDLYKMELAQSVLTATGEDLDKLAANYFIERKFGTMSYGKVRFYIKDTDKDHAADYIYPDVRIQKGTVITTQGTASDPSLQFQTIDDVYVRGTTKTITNNNTTYTSGIGALPRDNTGYKYVEILCESISTGIENNIGPFTIVSTSGTMIETINNVTNPFSFSGASDPEDDVSLALRISLAITGSNIGTKDGYLSYVLQQSQVLDALVIGSGDEYMNRDIITIVDQSTGNNVTQHSGGKVDIYVRTNSTLQSEFEYTVTFEDLDNDYGVPRHVLFSKDSYPVERVVSITGQISNADNSVTYKTYVNADDYELENRTDDMEYYYIDIPWDFSIKSYFPDEQYYPLLNNLSESEIIRLKTKLDNELQIAFKYMSDLSYKIKWNFIDWSETLPYTIDNFTTMFNYGKYTDNLYYKLKMKSDNDDGAILGGRIFVRRENKIFVRAYVTPDFKLVKDTSEMMGSVRARDYIQWFNKTTDRNNLNGIVTPVENEKLLIKFIHNNGIKALQDGIEIKRVLTADVLIKAAKQKDIEIKFSAVCSPSYNSQEMRTRISNALTFYVNSQKKLGAYLDQSDIVYIVKSIDGVISVNIDSVELSFIGIVESQIISCKPDEFFFLKNLIVSITNTLNR